MKHRSSATPAETIRFALAPSLLGQLLLARSVQGVCAIAFGDDAAALAASVQQDFPAARLQRDDVGLQAGVAAVLDWLAAPQQSLQFRDPMSPSTLPLDLRGSAFQKRVWHALQEIPPGCTASYGEIARALGAPQAARAVGAACARNRLAIAVPCHRALRSDGGLANFRWGVARKAALLDLEAAPDAREAAPDVRTRPSGELSFQDPKRQRS